MDGGHAVCLGHAQQTFATCRASCKVAGQDGLMRSWIAVCEQDRPRPGEGQANGQGGVPGDPPVDVSSSIAMR